LCQQHLGPFNGNAVAIAVKQQSKVRPAPRSAAISDPQASHVELASSHRFAAAAYGFVCLHANPEVEVAVSDRLATGVLCVFHQSNTRVNKSMVQSPPAGIWVDAFEVWTPRRRPDGKNIAIQVHPPLAAYGAASAANGLGRPTTAPNAWAAAWDDPEPAICLRWPSPQVVARVELTFDADLDHAMESVLMMHPESRMPYCVRNVRVRGFAGQLLAGGDGRADPRRRGAVHDHVELALFRGRPGHGAPGNRG
jgi:hypothetical protein